MTIDPTTVLCVTVRCGGGCRCKPQVISLDAVDGIETTGPIPSVSALAADMLRRGWVTQEEYTQLLFGDR